MANILAQHDFLDPKDQLHQLMTAKDFLDLGSLLAQLRCVVAPSPGQPEPPPGFIDAQRDNEDDYRTVSESGLTVYSGTSFFEVSARKARDGFWAEHWREVRYLDDARARLVCFPNDQSDQPRLMVYGPGPYIKGEATLRAVSFELAPAPQESGFDWVGSGPFFYPIKCQPKDSSNACVNESCPEGTICTPMNIEDRETHCSSVCACLDQD